MYHPIPRHWLLATNKIEVAFRNAHDHKIGHGSGFWVRNGEALVFATNRHVIDIEYRDPKYKGHGYVLSSMQVLSFDSSGRSGRQQVNGAVIATHEDPNIDIALLQILDVSNPDGISVVPANIDVIADTDFLETELEWGAQVSFSSFQPWRDTHSERPILRTGILSSDPAYAFVSTKIGRDRVHLLEAFSFAGSSGSPVIANAKGIPTGPELTGGDFRPARIIGMMTGHLRNEESDSGVPDRTHTGLSFCHRSDLLLAMVHGAEPLQGSTFEATD